MNVYADDEYDTSSPELERLLENFELTEIDESNVPAGVIPMEFDSVEELELFLSEYYLSWENSDESVGLDDLNISSRNIVTRESFCSFKSPVSLMELKLYCYYEFVCSGLFSFN